MLMIYVYEQVWPDDTTMMGNVYAQWGMGARCTMTRDLVVQWFAFSTHNLFFVSSQKEILIPVATHQVR